MSGYEDRRRDHVAAWGAALPDRLERLRWTRGQIDEWRTDALRRLVTAARSGSPWHAERLAAVDVDALDAADLAVLPTMTKDDLMANFDDVVTDRRVTLAAAEEHLAALTDDAYFHDDLHVVASGGSSGTRGVFAYGWDAWIDVHLGLGRFVIADAFAAAVPGPVRTAVVAATHATHMTAAASRTFASDTVEMHRFPVALPIEEIVDGLNRVQPATVISYASALGLLAAEADAGRLRIAPRRLVATSEPLLPELRAAVEAAFAAPVANCWASSEAGIMAMGCWRSAGMHLLEDTVVVEPVDERGEPVPPGTRSAKVLVTNLFNPVLPLIRYELTDEVTLLDEPCPCGSAHRRVADVEGRRDDLLRYGTVVVHPHVVRSALARHPEIVEFQVRQTTAGADVLVLASAPADLALVAKQVAAALEGVGVPAPVVDVRGVDALPRHPGTGKLRRFVPLDVS